MSDRFTNTVTAKGERWINRGKGITMGAPGFMSGSSRLYVERKDGTDNYQIKQTDLAAKNANIILHQNALYPSYADAICKSRANAVDIESA